MKRGISVFPFHKLRVPLSVGFPNDFSELREEEGEERREGKGKRRREGNKVPAMSYQWHPAWCSPSIHIEAF
jgi:hypothetical protein